MIKLNWQVTLLLLAVLGASTFLGFEHTIAAGAVTGIFSSILGGLLVGHFGNTNGNGGKPPGGP